MQGCFVEFSPPDDSSLLRTIDCVNCVAALKRDGTLDEEQMAKELSASERAYFWEPSSEELQEWNDFWFSTPLPLRHSPSMPTPGWSFESMVSAISEAKFDITGVATEGSKCYLTFEPESYPFGGVGCLVLCSNAWGTKSRPSTTGQESCLTPSVSHGSQGEANRDRQFGPRDEYATKR